MEINDDQGKVEANMQPTQNLHVNQDFKVVGPIWPIWDPRDCSVSRRPNNIHQGTSRLISQIVEVPMYAIGLNSKVFSHVMNMLRYVFLCIYKYIFIYVHKYIVHTWQSCESGDYVNYYSQIYIYIYCRCESTMNYHPLVDSIVHLPICCSHQRA